MTISINIANAEAKIRTIRSIHASKVAELNEAIETLAYLRDGGKSLHSTLKDIPTLNALVTVFGQAVFMLNDSQYASEEEALEDIALTFANAPHLSSRSEPDKEDSITLMLAQAILFRRHISL